MMEFLGEVVLVVAGLAAAAVLTGGAVMVWIAVLVAYLRYRDYHYRG